MNLFEIFGKIGIRNNEANNSLDQTNNKANQVAKNMQEKFETIGTGFTKVGQSITKAGIIMTTTLTTGIVGLAAVGTKYNMQMENFRVNLTTLLGSSKKADKLLNDLKLMASTTPFETSDLINATQTMIGFGISARDSKNYLSMLGDISMGNSEKLKGLSLAFAQVQSTGKLTGQDLMQMINQGFNPLPYICKKTGENMAKVKERMSEGKVSAKEVAEAMQTATSEGGPFYKGMENGAQTISGRLSTLKDNFMELIGKLTESLLPTFEKVVNWLTKLVDKFNNMDQEQRNQILKWAGIVASIGPVLVILGKLTGGFGKIFTIIGKVKGAGGIAGLITKFSGLLPVIGSVIGPIAGVVAILGILVVALGGPKKALDKLKQAFNFCKDVIKDFLDKINFGDKIQKVRDKLEILGDKLKGLKDLFKVLGTIIGVTLLPVITTLSGVFNGLLSALQPVLDFIGYIIDYLSGIGEIIVGIFTLNGDKILSGLSKVFNSIIGIVITPIKIIGSYISGFFSGITSFLGSLLEKIGLKPAIDNIKNAIVNWWSGIVTWWKEKWNSVCSFFSMLSAWFNIYIIQPFVNTKNKIKGTIENLKNSVVEKFNFLKNKTSAIFNNVKNSITQPIQKAKDKVNEYINKIKSIFNGFKAKLKMPHIKISGSWDLKKLKFPKFGVDWYAKAMDSGMLLNEPTIFGINKNGQFMGGGEKGSETIVGTNSLMNMIQQSVNNQNRLLEARIDTLIEILLQYLPLLTNRQLCLDSGELVGALTSKIDKSLGDLANKKGRGR